MNILFLSVLIGIGAGVLDILPMIIKKLNKKACISAFLQYFFLAIIIVNIDLPYVAWWLEGGLISLAMCIPVVIIISENDKKPLPIILANSVLLGTLISIAAHYLR